MRSRLFSFLATGALIVISFVVVSPGASGDEPLHEVMVTRTLPAGSVKTWVDVEQPGLSPEDVIVEVTSSEVASTVTMSMTTFGVTGVVASGPGTLTVTVTAVSDVDAHFAVTTADSSGVIVDGWDEHVVLTPVPVNPPESSTSPAATTSTGTTASSTATTSPEVSTSSAAPSGSTSSSLPSSGLLTQSASSTASSSPVVSTSSTESVPPSENASSQATATAIPAIVGGAPTGGTSDSSRGAVMVVVALGLAACGILVLVKLSSSGSARTRGKKAVRTAAIGVSGLALVVSMVGLSSAPFAKADESILTEVPGSAGFSSDRRVPVVETEAGVGSRLSTNPAATVMVPGVASATAALIRVSVLDAASAVDVYATGAPVLTVGASRSASTVVLVPVNGSEIPLYASATVDVRLEVLASFDSDPSAPGAVVALPQLVSRADTSSEELAGDMVGVDPVTVGLVGQGGIPSTGVRAVFLTATLTAPAAGTLTLAGQEVPVAAGRTSVTTVVAPDELGAMDVSYSGGSGEMRVDLRGWVPEPAQGMAKSNVLGSFVPLLGTESEGVDVARHQEVSLDVPASADTQYAVAMVSAGPSTVPSLFDVGQGEPGRGRGAVVDPVLGALPQLALARVVDGSAIATVRDVAVSAEVQWVGSFLGTAVADGTPSVTITSPTASETVDLAASNGLTMTGTVSGDVSVESVILKADGDIIGSGTLTYSDEGTTWTFVGVAPAGTQTVTAVATDRAGTVSTTDVTFDVLEVQPTDVVISPDTVVLPDVTDDGIDWVASIDDNTVTLNAEPTFAPGSVLVSDSVPGAPQGFLRRVDSIDKVGDQWVVNTSVAALTDAIWHCDEDDTVDLLSAGEPTLEEEPSDADPDEVEVVDDGVSDVVLLEGDGVDVSPLDSVAATGEESDESTDTVSSITPSQQPSAEPMAAPIAMPAFQAFEPMSFGINTTRTDSIKVGVDVGFPASGKIKDVSKTNDEAKSATMSDIKASAGVMLSASAQVTISIKFALKISIEWKWLVPVPTIDDFTVKTVETTKVQHTVTLSVKGTLEKSYSKTLATITPAVLTFSIGPVPVVVTTKVNVSLDAGISLSAAIELTMGSAVQREQTYGFSYSTKGGMKNLNDQKTTYDEKPASPRDIGKTSFKADAEASVGITAALSISLYDAFGPVMTLGAKAMLDGSFEGTLDGMAGTLSASGRLGIDLGVSLSGKVEFKVPIIDKVLLSATLLSVGRTYHLWDSCWTSDSGIGKCIADTTSATPSSSPSSSTPSASPSPSTSTAPPSGENLVPDSALRTCIVDRKYVPGFANDPGWTFGEDPGEITKKDVAYLLAYMKNDRWGNVLSCPGYGISDLTGIENFSSVLQILGLAQNKVTDTSKLSSLVNLTYLDLSENQVLDVSGLSTLVNLTSLDLGGNVNEDWSHHLSDISSLSELVNLHELDLDTNNVSDVSALASLVNLEELDLADNDVSDISALASLLNLQTLYVSDNNIIDVSSLAGLVNLHYLYLDSNRITDVSALAGLGINLWMLDLSENSILDISVLAGLTNLESLNLIYNKISDVSALAGLLNLTHLYLDNNRISDVSALAGLVNLGLLDLSDNHISNVSPLVNLTNLWFLGLSNNQITDVSPLSNLTSLYELWLTDNLIDDFSPLGNLVNTTIHL